MIDFDIDVIRSCQYCFRVEKFYRLNDNSKKCVKYIRSSYVCDFAFLNFTRWKQLETQRKKLKTNLYETYIKQQRLFRQLNFVKNEQRTMIENKMKNIANLKKKKKIIAKAFNFLMNFVFKQIVFSNFFEKWFWISLISFDNFVETFAIFDNFSYI